MADMVDIPTLTGSTSGDTATKPAATKRSTAAKRAATTRARKQGAAARQRTQRKVPSRANAAEAAVQREVAGGLGRVQTYAEKAMLVQVGAALVARDNVVDAVEDLRGRYNTRAKLERELTRFERRGLTARNRFERELKKTRTRAERELRQRRTRTERELRTGRVAPLQKQADLVSTRLENLVQEGLKAGQQVATTVSERVAKVA